jgi:hypothetical protein
MAVTITVRDESTGGKTLNEISLEILTERISVRELIRSRVYQEVKDFNVRQSQEFRGLIQPSDSERTLNGFRLRKPRQINWKEQLDKAIEAFKAHQIIILVDEKQIDSLEEEIEVQSDTTVVFLRLTLLVGG